MTAASDATGNADQLTPLLTALLQALRTLEFVGRHLDPDRLAELLAAIGSPDATLHAAIASPAPANTGDLGAIHGQLAQSAEATLAAYNRLRAASTAQDLRSAYRAMRGESLALEALYPLAGVMAPVSTFFLDPAARDDPDLIHRLTNPAQDSGVMHIQNAPDTRGGVSLYIPESYRSDRVHPLVIALHGGSGHGRNFLWNWVRTARSRGMILACPTAMGPTWALGGPDTDSPNIARIVEFVRQRWNVDASRMLLTGMSDGGTFTLLSGLQEDSPFTHLAPFAAGFHPLLAEMADARRVRGLPIYLVHGTLDWMFPVELAQTAHRMLSHVGAKLTYREIVDLAHVYPRDENTALVDWFIADRG